MTVIRLHIPDELESALQQVPGDVEAFILNAVKRQLDTSLQADDADIEASASLDLGDDFLSEEELNYYLNLPDNVSSK